jgi:hypothetical protein
LAEILAAHLPAPSSLGGIPDRPQGGVPTTGLGRGLPRWPSWADVQTANGVLGQNRLDIDVHHALSSWPSNKKSSNVPSRHEASQVSLILHLIWVEIGNMCMSKSVSVTLAIYIFFVQQTATKNERPRPPGHQERRGNVDLALERMNGRPSRPLPLLRMMSKAIPRLLDLQLTRKD